MDVAALVEQFHRDGYLVIPDALAPEQVERLRAGVERAFAELDPEADLYGPTMQRIWRPKMFERGPAFEELVDNPRVIDLVEWDPSLDASDLSALTAARWMAECLAGYELR